MKKIILIILVVAGLFGYNKHNRIQYHGTSIGTVTLHNNQKNAWLYNTNYSFTVYCIEGVQYMGFIGPRRMSLTPVFSKDGKIKTCKVDK